MFVTQQSIKFHVNRYKIILGIFTICLLGLSWRLIDLTVIDRSFLQRQGDARSLRVLSLPAYRGMITDRTGEPLAISTPVESIWVNPATFDIDTPQLEKMAKLLNMSAADIKDRIEQAEGREFVYLKRSLEPYLASQIKALNVPGVNLQREFRRFYPAGEVAAHLLGVTNVDDQGQEGLELVYNDWLAGQAGKQRVIKDRLGRVVTNLGIVAPPRPGKNLTLSIDNRIQYLAYRELKEAMRVNKASSGSVIVLDVPTGEILAMVNQPSFNPNVRMQRVNDGRYRNRAITDLFEPGSVIKTFTVAAALNSGKFKPHTQIDTHPGWLSVDGNIVRDIHPKKVLTVTEILQKSSNVGVTKMILELPPTTLWELLNKAGFGKLTASGFPGENEGRLVNHPRWRPFAVATLGFGYGLSVTPLQLAQAYTIFANEGRLRPVSLLRQEKPEKAVQVMDAKIAKQMLTMLEAVVEIPGGSGSKARIASYRVAGKTGTARMLGANGYEKDHHVATFAGIAPVTNPRLVVLVVMNDPQLGDHYGGTISAPIFSKVMGGALQILQVMPDKIQAQA